MGVEIRLNSVIGRTFTIDELFATGYGAVFVGPGAGLPKFLAGARREPDRHLFRQRVPHASEVQAYLFPEYDTPIKIGKVVAVVGGGNVAMDAARTALRLGAEKVIVLYRRTESEMPARVEEVHHAKEEGIEFHFLVNPVQFLGENGRVGGWSASAWSWARPTRAGRPGPLRSKVPISSSPLTVR